MKTFNFRLLQKLLLVVTLVFYSHTCLFAQCTINSSSCGGYTVQISITPIAIVPSSPNCNYGYNYNVQFNYSVTVSGVNTCYNGNIGIQPQILCNNQNNGNYTIQIPAPLVGAADATTTYTGILTTQTNPWSSATDCNTATPTSQNCNSIQVTIFGPGISTNTYPCPINNSTITTGTLAASFCAGTTVTVPYAKTGSFNSGNIFTAQLSNASGSFSNPVTIGTTASINSGNIAASIPTGTPAGSAYRIRVVSSNPSITGSNNGANINISSIAASVNITASPSNTICTNNTVTFTATPINGGNAPTYKWTKNGNIISGAISQTYSASAGTDFISGDIIRCVCTSNLNCVALPTVTSAPITMQVNSTPISPTNAVNGSRCGPGTVPLSVIAPSGSTVDWYSAANGGNLLLSGNSNYTTLSNSTTTTYYAASRNTTTGCVSANRTPVIAMIEPTYTPSVSIAISAGANPVCNGSELTFVATPINGGTLPTYQWTKNGTNIQGATSISYTGIAGINFVNSNQIRVVMTSNLTCASLATVTSAAIVLTVKPSVSPAITITPSQYAICAGGTNFTSSHVNGGLNPTYQWVKNGIVLNGETNGAYNGSGLVTGDIISCVLSSNAVCAVPASVISNTISTSLTIPITTWLGNTTNWSSASNWSNGIPNSSTSAIIASGTSKYPIVTCLVKCYNLTIQTGAVLTMNASNVLEVYGNFINNGAFVANKSEVKFKSCNATNTAQHNLSSDSSITTTFYNLTLDDLMGATLNMDVDLINTLTLTNGSFTNNGKIFSLKSNALGTARIAPVAVTANYIGDIKNERYAAAGRTGWAQLGTPVIGATLAQWYDNFEMSGFTGVFQGASINGFISVYTYDETAPGDFDSPGSYIAATNVTNSIAVGKGFWVYLGTGPIYTDAITVNVTGQPYVGDFNFNPLYSNSNNPNDGYNLMANPYPSTIDWLSPAWTKINIDNAIYCYQADNNQYASFVDGISTNGGSRYIASSQGFFVQANAPGAVLSISENAKSNVNPRLIRETNPDNLLRLTLSGNNMNDETAIHLNSEATNYFDSKYDALKFFSPDSLAPSIASIIDGADASINSIPFDAKTISIPVKANVGVAGIYTLAWSGLQEFAEGTCIVLEDLENGVKTDLVSKSDYTFKAKVSARKEKARFLIHISTPLKRTTAAANCSNSNDGSITLQNPYLTACKVELSDINNVVLKDATFSDASYTFNGLKSGTYKLTYLETSQCEVMVQTVTIEASKNVTAKFELGSSSVYTGNLINFKAPVNKGNSYSWDFGDGNSETGTSTAEHKYSNEGTYVVTLTNTNGECKDSRSLILNVLNPIASGANYMDVQKLNDSYYAVFNFDSVITAHISVARLTGQIVIPSQTFVGNNGNVKIDLNNEEQGMYLITLRSGNKIVSKKIIK